MSKKPSYKSCSPWIDPHLCQKWGQYSKVCNGTWTNHGQFGRKPSEVPLGAIFCEEFSMEFWYAMFGVFPRYYITYHDSTHWIFIFFLEFPLPPFQI
jgi:hypothetical protein